jgi:argininosuccinate synthase
MYLTAILDNLAHCSYESGILEKPDMPAPKNVWTRTVGTFPIFPRLT